MCKAQGVLLLVFFAELAHSWDIAVTAGNRIEFYTNDGDKQSTVNLNSRNLTAITYDEVHNILLYVDKQNDNDAICAYNITSSMEYTCFIQGSGRNIHGLAFDPVTEILFYTDTKERSINWFSLNPGRNKNKVSGNLLIKIDNGIPTEIVVDSCRGYIYWINTNRTPSTIERVRSNGLEREVVVNATGNLNLDSLAIDYQAQKLYWKMYDTIFKGYVYSADFDGKNKKPKVEIENRNVDNIAIVRPNTLTVSKQFLLSVSRCSSCNERPIFRLSKPLNTYNYDIIIQVNTKGSVGITTNDKIKEQFKGISECNQVLHDYETNYIFNQITEAYDYSGGPFCVHGMKWTLNGQSICNCTPGYIGERCEVSVCESTYCFQGNCSITDQGFPICRCNDGYSGDRCEVNLCHGYCLQGNCSFNDEGLPECRCNPGYSGQRCEMNVCHQYCLNNGICSLNEEDEPVCECMGEYNGERCDVPLSLNNDVGSVNVGVEPVCQCDGTHESSTFKVDTKKTISTNSNYYPTEGNLTLADLLANWRKPVATINVFVEVKPKN